METLSGARAHVDNMAAPVDPFSDDLFNVFENNAPPAPLIDNSAVEKDVGDAGKLSEKTR